MTNKKLISNILVLAVVTLIFQIGFFKEIDQDDLDNMIQRHQGGKQYIGDLAPDFTAVDMDGTTFTLSDYVGTNVVVINFFTTWCGPCAAEMPELMYFDNYIKDQPVKFLAISVGEQPDVVRGYIEKNKLTLRVAIDPEEVIARKFQIGAYPTTLVINPGGRIMMYEEGAIANADVSLVPLIERMVSMIEHMPDATRDSFLKDAPDALAPRLKRHSTNDIDVVVEKVDVEIKETDQ